MNIQRAFEYDLHSEDVDRNWYKRKLGFLVDGHLVEMLFDNGYCFAIRQQSGSDTVSDEMEKKLFQEIDAYHRCLLTLDSFPLNPFNYSELCEINDEMKNRLKEADPAECEQIMRNGVEAMLAADIDRLEFDSPFNPLLHEVNKFQDRLVEVLTWFDIGHYKKSVNRLKMVV